MRKLQTFIVVLVLAACAGLSPEQKIHSGYKSASAAVKGSTVLLQRHAISSAEAQRVEALGRTAKAGLDADKEALAVCRATVGATCDGIGASINLYSTVLMELENYLKAKEAQQ